jgi:LPS-assembly protein
MTKGVYSPCNLCAEDPTRPPLWQVKAVKLTQDNVSHDVRYEDAWLEVKGVPVAYTPYFSHPDPTVKKRSGFLPPSMGSSSDLGFIVQVPYFFNISPSEDLTLTPTMTSDEGPLLSADYRRHFQKGRLDALASITQDSEEDVRGHIDAEGRFDIDKTWRWGFEAQRTTDDTYLRRYSFESPQSLTSRLYTEGFRGRNYFAANAYAFQGLEATDDPGTTPLVLPMLDYRHVGEPGKFGGRSRMDVNLLSLVRSDGTDTRRFSVNAGYDIPYVGPIGDVYTLSTSLRGDIYQVNDLERNDQENYNGVTERLIPEIALNWRYPFVQSEDASCSSSSRSPR